MISTITAQRIYIVSLNQLCIIPSSQSNKSFLKSKTHIRECLLFKFYQGKNSIEATRSICKIYPDDVLTERTSERSFSKFREGLSTNSCTLDPTSPLWSILEDCCRRWLGVTSQLFSIEFKCCQQTTINAWHEIGKMLDADSFQTELKSQDP